MLLLIEAPPGFVQECHVGPVRRFLTRVLGGRLDRRIAEGASPDSSVLLTLRAAELIGLPRRQALADSIFELLEQAAGVSTGSGAWVVDWVGVRRARWELAELAVALESDRPVSARGVALTDRLLTDGTGPLYYPDTTVDLARAARAATLELDPARAVGEW